MPDGRLGVLEAGYNATLWTRLTPLDYKLHAYPGTLWVRERLVPLTPDEDAQLTAFAVAAADKRYATGKFVVLATQFTPRGVLRTSHLARPRGIRERYTCGELILEALIYAGLIDGLVLDRQDGELAPAIEALGMRVLVTETVMGGAEDRRRLAGEVLGFARATALTGVGS